MLKRVQNRLEKVKENAEFLDKRAYFTVDSDGIISRKKMNLTIPAMVFCKDEKMFNVTLEKEIDRCEREKEKKIERLSNLSIEKLKENFTKLVIKNEVEFAKRYGKELALRDGEEFIKTLFNLSLMDDIRFRKPLMALAMKEILGSVGWDDNIGYLVISYFSKQRYELHFLENAISREDKNVVVPEVLDLVAYKKVLDSYTYRNEKKYAYMLSNWIEKYSGEKASLLEKEMIDSIKV